MDINDATWAIMREMSKLPYNVDDQQITRAKNQLKAQILFAQDGPSGELCETAIMQVLHKFIPQLLMIEKNLSEACGHSFH